MFHRRPVAVVLTVVLLGVGAAGCGADKDAEAREVRAEKVRKVRAEERRRERVTTAKAQQAAVACKAGYGRLLEASRALGGRLVGAGMSNADYGERLDEVRAAYDAAPDPGEIGGECLERVAAPLEESYNEFAEAETRWDACLEAEDCEADGIEAKLQAHWVRASKQFERAEDGLIAIATPDAED